MFKLLQIGLCNYFTMDRYYYSEQSCYYSLDTGASYNLSGSMIFDYAPIRNQKQYHAKN
jgi:hypothetical protein